MPVYKAIPEIRNNLELIENTIITTPVAEIEFLDVFGTYNTLIFKIFNLELSVDAILYGGIKYGGSYQSLENRKSELVLGSAGYTFSSQSASDIDLSLNQVEAASGFETGLHGEIIFTHCTETAKYKSVYSNLLFTDITILGTQAKSWLKINTNSVLQGFKLYANTGNIISGIFTVFAVKEDYVI